MAKNDGGTAFPSSEEQTDGMTLRDWFAGQASIGLSASLEREPNQPWEMCYPPQQIAKMAYEIADAMLGARKR